MKLRTQAFVLVFSLIAAGVGTTVIGILGGIAALKTGNPTEMLNPYKDLYWLGVAITAALLVMIYRVARKAQDTRVQTPNKA